MRSRTDFLVFVIGHLPAGKRLIAGTGGFFIALLSRRKSAGIKKRPLCGGLFHVCFVEGSFLLFGCFQRCLAEFFHCLFNFQRTLAGTCTGGLVSVFQLGFGVFLEFSIQCCNFFNQFFHNPFCVTSFIMFRKNTTFLEIIAGISRFFLMDDDFFHRKPHNRRFLPTFVP